MTSTGLELHKNDGTESFTLKAESVKSSVGMGAVTKSILGGASSLAGGEITLAKETYEISGQISGTEAADYPNSGTYADHDLGMTEELKRAAKEWMPSQADGFNELHYDQGANLRGSIDGVLTDVSIIEDRTSDGPRQYSFTLEWSHFDVYIG